eukprot:6414786-Amphidinium_carterae.1
MNGIRTIPGHPMCSPILVAAWSRIWRMHRVKTTHVRNQSLFQPHSRWLFQIVLKSGVYIDEQLEVDTDDTLLLPIPVMPDAHIPAEVDDVQPMQDQESFQ